MSTYSSNTTIKINANINTAGTPASNPTVTDTSPSTGYCICQVFISAAGSAMTYSVTVGSVLAYSGSLTNASVSIPNIYYAKGNILLVTTSGGSGGANVANISGVSFINTP